ncbi:MAG: hypothetical protein ACKOXB_10300 [Flavobacteriales bacterium]
MKTTFKTSLFLFALIASFAITGCKSKKKEEAKKPVGEVLVNEYCTGPEFFSDKKTFRANAVGESMDQQTAHNKSLIEAKQRLASFISTTIKSTIDNYVKDNEHNKKEDLEKKYEGLTREVVNQKLAGVKIICQKLTKTTEGNYKSYTAIELGADDLVQAINDRLTKDESLKVDYDYEKFKKTFEAEMEKMNK